MGAVPPAGTRLLQRYAHETVQARTRGGRDALRGIQVRQSRENNLLTSLFCLICNFLRRSALLCEMEQRLKELNPESGASAGAVALRRSLP